LQKFQQKAQKQTKQKKSKSAEFLMAKEDGATTEGIENPAFNISSTDLSAYQTSGEKVIKHDKPDSTLAAHPQKLRLQACAEPRGNEYSRNYFDPLMDEEINPRQCGMGVSGEVLGHMDEKLLYDELMKLLDEDNKEDSQGTYPLVFNIFYHVQKIELSPDTTSLNSPHVLRLSQQPKNMNFHSRRRLRAGVPKVPRVFLPKRGSPSKATSVAAGVMKEDIVVSERPESTSKSCEFHEDVENGMIPPYIEQFERDAQANIILLGRSSMEQVGQDTWSEPTLALKSPRRMMNSYLGIAPSTAFNLSYNSSLVCCEAVNVGAYTLIRFTGPSIVFIGSVNSLSVLSPINSIIVRISSSSLYSSSSPSASSAAVLTDERSQEPHHIQIQLKCLRGIKDKVPRGSYFLKVSLLNQLGNCALPSSKREQPRNGIQPISHDGNFYDVGIYFNQSLYMVLPSNEDVKPGMTLLFEFFLCGGTYVFFDRAVGWGVFPFCDDNFNIVEGKFKCPLLRGHYDKKLECFSKIEDFICSDLDHWLCNLYFQSMLKENDLTDESLREKSSSLMNMRARENEEYSGSMSYLEELEKHRYSVCSSSVSQVKQPRRFFKQFHFLQVVILTELQVAKWQSQKFWCIILLLAFIWFVRLYLHYCSQWLFLQVISIPVTKFCFYPHTVELCYPSSLLRTGEELSMVLVGPLALNALILFLAIIKWGCQQLFSSAPTFLSKLIIALGLWTVLDPLAVFVVDVILGRLTYDGETPVADAAKLYWSFIRTKQSGIPGAVITLLVYLLLFIISWAVLYLYCLRLHNDSWILDTFQRIHSDEGMFFIPYDLEISNQELSYIVKKAEQWRGINGERRKVAVYDYIWKNHDSKSGVPSCDLQHQDEITACAAGPEGIISHVSIRTTYPSGFQELYRHFLRLPDGAIVEVFGDITGISFLHSEVTAAIQSHICEMDSVRRESSEPEIKEREKIASK
ncbi:uncharacterized protein LOC122746851, partial [Dromiciops gliroides]|uniref:uncharacterized protein LOC122746851 n=1 Tax=Dromiciops gliroides TaxID=33562 RepID=UPI001CC7CFE6